MKVSVVIVTKDRHEILPSCLQSIVEQEISPEEVIIIDGSEDPDKTSEIVEKFKCLLSDNQRLYYEFVQPGICAQRNRGIAVSTGDVVLFVDDDAVLDRRLIKYLRAAYKENPDIYGVGGLISNNNFSRLGRLFHSIFHISLFEDKLMQVEFDPPRNWGGEPIPVNRLHGGCASFKKEIFQEYLFNKKLPSGGYGSDDFEFCARVAQKYKLAVEPRCKIFHHLHPSGRIPLIERAQGQIIGYFYVAIRQQHKKAIDLLSLAWLNIGLFFYYMYNALKRRDIKFILSYPIVHAKIIIHGIKNILR